MKVNQPADTNGVATNPPDDRSITDLCFNYLSTLHTGSWGRMFYIHDEADRKQAAKYIAETIEGVMNHAKQQ